MRLTPGWERETSETPVSVKVRSLLRLLNEMGGEPAVEAAPYEGEVLEPEHKGQLLPWYPGERQAKPMLLPWDEEGDKVRGEEAREEEARELRRRALEMLDSQR